MTYKYIIPVTEYSNDLPETNTRLNLQGILLGQDSAPDHQHQLELMDHSLFMIGTDINKVGEIGNNNEETYKDKSNPAEAFDQIHEANLFGLAPGATSTITNKEKGIGKRAKYPHFTLSGRGDFIGGASINTRYQDLRIGLYDIASFENTNTYAKHENKKRDQIGSALIRSRGLDPSTIDASTKGMHVKTGLEVYHGLRVTDFGDEYAFNDKEGNNATVSGTGRHQSTHFTHDKLDKTYELSYVRDLEGKKYQKTLAHNIYLHSDTITQISNEVNRLIKMDSAGIVIKNNQTQIKLNNTDVEVKGEQFYVEEELCIGPKNGVNYRLKIDDQKKLVVTKFDNEINKGIATIIDVADSYTSPPEGSRLDTYLTGIHHGNESATSHSH